MATSILRATPRPPATTWVAVDAVARRQHGVLSHTQLLESGLSGSAIQRAMQSGRLQRLHRGVYRMPGTLQTTLQRIAGAVLATAPASAASHRSAGAVWDVHLDSRHQLTASAEVTVARRRGPRHDGIIVHRSLDLRPQHVVLHKGILVTNPLRLLLDLGAVLPPDVVAEVLAQLLARGIVTIAGVRAFHEQLRRRGRNGCGVLGAVLTSRALGERPCDSVLEDRFAELARAHGIPSPIFQYPVQVGTSIKRVDFAYPDLLVALELDSWQHHGMLPDDFYADRARAFELSALGWQVAPITWRDLDRRPGWVFEHLALLLTAAMRRLDLAS